MKKLILFMALILLIINTKSANSAVIVPIPAGAYSVKVPSIKANGSLDFSNRSTVSMYFAQSIKRRHLLVGRAHGNSGTVSNASRKKQVYSRPNVGSTIRDVPIWVSKSKYTVYKHGAVDLWVRGKAIK